ncbi:T9SS type A sorting domain-containing protein [Leptobacterium sp. I13]|uniref:T9SS type A sorting domain-containing protein n=1 Tax=Leptobacterium meishanense TaxID=3128904 RepID=UPI0030EDD684
MKIKLQRIGVFILLIISAIGNAQNTDVFFVANPSSYNVSGGQTFDVIFEIQANDQQIDLVEMHLNFDPSIIEVQSLTYNAGGILPIELIAPSFNNTTGTIDLAYGAISGFPSGTFGFLTVTFNALNITDTAIVDFSFTFPRESISTFTGSNVLVNTTAATVNVTQGTLGVDDIEVEEILLYPNPASSEFYIELPNSISAKSLTIYDVNGRLVHSEIYPSSGSKLFINVSSLSNGLYFALLTTDQNLKIEKKFLVDK